MGDGPLDRPGDASHAAITLAEHDGALVFTVADDGAGFDPDTTTRGSGLQNMADRLDAHGGSLTIHSTLGARCPRLVWVAPLQSGVIVLWIPVVSGCTIRVLTVF